MARKESKEAREVRRRAEELWAQSEEMLDGGDYLMARRIAAQVQEIAPHSDCARKANERVSNLGSIDRTAVYALLGSFALYLFGWAYALS